MPLPHIANVKLFGFTEAPNAALHGGICYELFLIYHCGQLSNASWGDFGAGKQAGAASGRRELLTLARQLDKLAQRSCSYLFGNGIVFMLESSSCWQFAYQYAFYVALMASLSRCAASSASLLLRFLVKAGSLLNADGDRFCSRYGFDVGRLVGDIWLAS